ncbi:hypothetical protein J7E88_18645 [Streptomyces sp. ISL-10]|uniref:hypothetical protein n=1 Tax=Streptomyces sp. ISL-10 TaxID=2819172 RepID=UPI001BEA9A90|nr:hypothetical protein [Streptomyces sp. ISL-10]MBT2367269.1 hypothetical protein [Streptomyces sp. ISL-10]
MAGLVEGDTEDEDRQDLRNRGVVLQEDLVMAGIAGDGQGRVVAEQILGPLLQGLTLPLGGPLTGLESPVVVSSLSANVNRSG